MRVYKDIKEFKKLNHAVVSIGAFDGVHFGHRKILERLVEKALANNGESVVITFYPHPRKVLLPHEEKIELINTEYERLKLFENIGINHLIILPFTKEFAETTPLNFVKNILIEKINAKHIVIGYDHHFGKDRAGDMNRVTKLSKVFGFNIEQIDAQMVGGVAISSTKIRDAIKSGDVISANQMLSYNFMLSGEVISGNKMGRTMGFPTANIHIKDTSKIIPANGVYAVCVKFKQDIFNGMLNIGIRPTMNLDKVTIELNIFDFNRDIYGEFVEVFIVDRIRDEIKFENVSDLQKQLNVDKQTVGKVLKENICSFYEKV